MAWRLILVRRSRVPALPGWLLPAAVLCAGLVAAGRAHPDALDAAHQAPVATGRVVPTVELSGTISDEGDNPMKLNMGCYHCDRLTLITGTAAHHGWTHCGARCEITPPTYSALVGVDADARLTIQGSWALPAGAEIRLMAGDPLDYLTGSGKMIVHGTLTAPAGGATITVQGSAWSLPQTLIVADALAGTWIAGTLPSGTALTIDSGLSTISLVALP